MVLCVLTAQAQSDFSIVVDNEGKIVAIPKLKAYDLKIPEVSYTSYTPSSIMDIETKLMEFTPDFQPLPDERPMNMQTLSAAYRPFFNVFTPMLQRVSPMAFDFSEVSITPLNDNFSFLIHGYQSTLPGGGGQTIINPMVVWNNDRWTVRGGGFGGRLFSPFHFTPGYTVGANTSVSYQATDWLKFNAWGEYAWYNGGKGQSAFIHYNPHFNHTNVGGSMEFKISDSFGIGIGMQQEYNPIRRKWESQPLIYPIFFSK